jgi:hypothetical protein
MLSLTRAMVTIRIVTTDTMPQGLLRSAYCLGALCPLRRDMRDRLLRALDLPSGDLAVDVPVEVISWTSRSKSALVLLSTHVATKERSPLLRRKRSPLHEVLMDCALERLMQLPMVWDEDRRKQLRHRAERPV